MNQVKIDFEKKKICINGVWLSGIKEYRIESLDSVNKVEMTITFDAEIIESWKAII